MPRKRLPAKPPGQFQMSSPPIAPQSPADGDGRIPQILDRPPAEDCVVQLMRKYGAPMDRNSYLTFAYGKDKPKPWTPELEAGLPEQFQDWSQFEKGNEGRWSVTGQTGSGRHPGTPTDFILEGMKRDGVPITRERYLRRAYGKTLPEWGAELEAELPEELQDWSVFERKRKSRRRNNEG